MPRGFVRLLAVLLFAVTVPVQGIAAVTKAQCMPLGHHQDMDHHGQQAPVQPDCSPSAACCAAALAAAPALCVIVELVSVSPCCTPFARASISLDTPERPPLAG